MLVMVSRWWGSETLKYGLKQELTKLTFPVLALRRHFPMRFRGFALRRHFPIRLRRLRFER